MDHNLTIPQDVLTSIVDILATQEDNPDIAALRNLSLTCKTLVPLCRRHLFSSLDLWISFPQKAQRFSVLLRSNPDIASYLKVLKFQFSSRGVSEYEEHILRVLHEKTPALRSIHLGFVDRMSLRVAQLDWNSLNSETTRLFLESLIQLPTIASIELVSIRSFPISLLAMCTDLVNVELKRVDSVPLYEVLDLHTRTKIPALLYLEVCEGSCGVLAPLNAGGGESLLDFSRLQEARIEIFSASDVDITKGIVTTSNCLHVLELNLDQYVSLESLGPCFVANQKTLRAMKLIVRLGNNEPHPLCGLNHLLRSLSGSDTSSALEQLNVSIYLNIDARLDASSRDWGEFDRVLTRPGAFPRLRGVDIYISWTLSYDGVRDYDVGEVLGRLSEERFSGLSEVESISFSFFQELEWA